MESMPRSSMTNRDDVRCVDNSAASSTLKQEEKSSASKFSFRCSQMGINRPLIPLKICLFFFFAAGGAVSPFLQVYIVQLGITVQQLSIMYMINPVVYFLGPAVSGIIADKIGQAKPVFVANLMVAVISLNCMLLIPTLKTSCKDATVFFDCSSQGIVITGISDSCMAPGNYTVSNCEYLCGANQTLPLCDQDNPDCNFPDEPHLSIYIATDSSSKNCGDLPKALQMGTSFTPSCPQELAANCTLVCLLDSNNKKCTVGNREFALVFSLSFILMMTFTTVMSNCYRMLDVTAMSMVKDHNSDFGRVRFWPILSSTVMSPLAGLMVDHFTVQGAPKNYAMAFYLFNLMILVTSVAVWRLDVRISPPGKKMWKKTMFLLKKPDFLAFALVVLILGTSWGLAKNFSGIYLKAMGAQSLLLGLVMATNSISGLPFLLTSNWWVKKIGTTNLLLLALVGYIAYYIGYFFLVNPWYAILCELTVIFTYHFLWVAVVRHCHDTSPEGLVATIIASSGGIHYGIGKGTGSLIGGWVRGNNNNGVDPLAFLVAAAICAFTMVCYGSFLFCRKPEENCKTALRKDYHDKESEQQPNCTRDESIEKLSSV